MEYIKTAIEGVWIIEPKVFKDARGYFFEAWKQQEFDDHIGHHVEFVQDNESKSSYGVLRGLHYQKGDYSQAKLVRVIRGTVVDVAVDIRRSSSTFGQYVAVELSEDNKRQLFIPRIRPWIRCPERGGRLHLQGGQRLRPPAGGQHPLGRSHHRHPVAHRPQGRPHVGEGSPRQESAGS